MSDANGDAMMMNHGTCTDTKESASDIINDCDDLQQVLVRYSPLSLSDIEKATKVYAQLEQQVAQKWEEESCKYEETENVELLDKPSITTRPRRNYANPEGIVTDTTLFPYHTCCYPLLQAYDDLYLESDEDNDSDDDDSDHDEEVHEQHRLQPIESNAILPGSFPRHFENFVLSRLDAAIPGFMPASVQVISAVFWNKAPKTSLLILRHPPPDLLNQTLVQLLDSYSTRCILKSNSNSSGSNGSSIQLQEDEGEEQQESTAASSSTSSSTSTSLWNTTAGNRLLFDACEWLSLDAAACSPAAFPAEPRERRSILLKLLKHAMSELSRDHGLAAVVMAKLMEHQDFDDLDCLQETLMILASEPIACGMPCDYDPGDPDADPDDVPDHKCNDYSMAGAALMFLVAHGMTHVTQEHATALSGFALYLAMREFGHLFRTKEEEEQQEQQDDATETKTSRTSSSAAAIEKQLNIHIKRSIVANRSVNDDDGDIGLPSDCNSKQVPTFLLSRIILGLGLRGAAERTRLQDLLQQSAPRAAANIDSVGQRQQHEKLLAQSLDSYYNCLRAQVAIAETVASTLPSTDRFFNLSSAIVFSISGTLVLDPTSFHSSHDERNQDRAFYVGQWPEYQNMRVSAPFRLADYIKNSTALVQQRMQPSLAIPRTTSSTATSRLEHLQQAATTVCEGRPHDDIRNAVRMLFLRDLVDVRVSRLGYLDFLLWCRFEVDVNDPVQFWHEFNLPCEEDDSDDDDVQDPDEDNDQGSPTKWDCDEDGQLLSSEELDARFDFSLFALVCEWNKPWTPESHMSYQPPFRRAVQTLALCLHRLHLPGELVRNIAQFLPRDAWPDPRKRCWNYNCLAEHDVEQVLVRHGAAENYGSLTAAKAEASIVCKKCRVAFYCSRACREEDYKAGHKKICGRPPFCIPAKHDMRFCELIANGGVGDEAIANQEESADQEAQETEIDDDDDDDDDGSWESIDSNDDMEEDEGDTNANQLTRQIVQFFDKYNDA